MTNITNLLQQKVNEARDYNPFNNIVFGYDTIIYLLIILFFLWIIYIYFGKPGMRRG